jgi:hypothetical protein
MLKGFKVYLTKSRFTAIYNMEKTTKITAEVKSIEAVMLCISLIKGILKTRIVNVA